jgi:hypothetical protein
VIGGLAALALAAAAPAEPTRYLAIVDLEAREQATKPPPQQGCRDLDTRTGNCIDWRTDRMASARIVLVFGQAPVRLFSQFHLPDLDGRALRKGRYLIEYRPVTEGYEVQVVALAAQAGGRWCMPEATFGPDLPKPAEGTSANGQWCIAKGKVASLVAEGQRQASRSSPYSLILGKLLTQQSTDICDTEDCWNLVMEGRMQVHDNFAGKPVTGTITVRYWAHANYVGKPVVAGLVARGEDGRYHSPMRTFVPEREQVCLDESWFFPARNGMAVPKAARRTPDGDICFRL